MKDKTPIPVEEFAAVEKAITQLHLAMDRTPGGRLVDDEDYTDIDVPIPDWAPIASLPKSAKDFVLAWAAMYAGAAPEHVSVIHFTRMLAEFGNSLTALYDGLAEKFKHGTKSLIDSLASSVSDRVHLNAAVHTITDEGDVVVVKTAADEFRARKVMVTVPLNNLHRLKFSPALSSQTEAAISTGHSCMSIKSWSRCRNVPEGLFALGWGSTLQWISNEYPQGDDTTLVCAFGYDPQKLDAFSVESVQAALREFVPEIEVVSVDSHDWRGDEFADGAWSIWDPNWVVKRHHEAFKPHGNVYFAGSDIADEWVGWIDGAIHSGTTVAAQVNANLS